MQVTRTTDSHSHSPDDRQMTTTRRLRRRRSHIRTRSGSLGQLHHQRRRRSGSSYSTSSSSSSSSEDEHHHRGKEIGATLVGAAGGGALAKEVLGGGKLATLGGAVAGAVAANALEKRHERYLFPSSILFSRHLASSSPSPSKCFGTPSSSGEKMKLTSWQFLWKFLDTKKSAAAVFLIENILTTTDIIIIIIIVIIIIIAALSIRARLKMRLKRNSATFSLPEIITSLGREIVVIAGDPGGIVEDDKSMYRRHSWR